MELEDWVMQDLHCVAATLKLFFRELPQPVVNEECYRMLRDAMAKKEQNSDSRDSLDFFRQALYKLGVEEYW